MATDHVKMLCDIGELNGLFEESSLEDLLQKIVNMVADHMLARLLLHSVHDYQHRQREVRHQ